MFTAFQKDISHLPIPKHFTNPFAYTPDPLSILAAEQLQSHLLTQTDWQHNFGILPNQIGRPIGKMFGVLVVKNQDNQLGYLSAFSGKLANSNHHPGFVPPVYDSLSETSFLNTEMPYITEISSQIKQLERNKEKHQQQIADLKKERRNFSHQLQQRLFDEYTFLNRLGESKHVRDVFLAFGYKNPPAGAGECAAPKLLNYAFANGFTPICMAEFWWGVSMQSDNWVHKKYYPACKEKCQPILTYMLADTI